MIKKENKVKNEIDMKVGKYLQGLVNCSVIKKIIIKIMKKQ